MRNATEADIPHEVRTLRVYNTLGSVARIALASMYCAVRTSVPNGKLTAEMICDRMPSPLGIEGAMIELQRAGLVDSARSSTQRVVTLYGLTRAVPTRAPQRPAPSPFASPMTTPAPTQKPVPVAPKTAPLKPFPAPKPKPVVPRAGYHLLKPIVGR